MRGPLQPSCSWSCFVLATLALAGCESAEETCEKARASAHETWTSYVVSLTTAMEEARDVQRSGKDRMRAIETRLGEGAKREADQRYEPGRGAWMRAFQGALHKACMKDPECDELKQSVARADDLLDDYGERLERAKAAAEATRGTIAEAQTRAAAVEIHAELPVLKAAKASTAALADACEGLPPPKADQ